MPPVPFRYVLNSLLYILITGCRWCDLPQGKIWASKSSAHRWLKRWHKDGTFEHLQARTLAIADSKGLINWNYGAIDGSSCSVGRPIKNSVPRYRTANVVLPGFNVNTVA